MPAVQPSKNLFIWFIVSLALMLSACGGGSGSIPAKDDGGVTPAARTLQQLVISPFIDSVAKGGEIYFTSTGIYDDQTSADLTAASTWAVDDLALASVDAAGKLTPLQAGVVKVTADVDGIHAEQTLTINEASLEAIQVIPEKLSIANGLQQSYQAIGRFSDGSYQDLSQQVTWGSSAPQVAAFGDATITALSTGTSVLTASLSGIAGQSVLTVNNAVLQRIELALDDSAVSVGHSTGYSVIGFYSDQSKHDLTQSALIQVIDNTVAELDSQGSSIQALSVGSTAVRAKVSAFSVEVVLQVTDAVLEKIEISPAKLSLPTGAQFAVKVTGIYSNGTSQDLTQQATWASSATKYAKVDNRTNHRGEVSALIKGSATISAYLGGLEASAAVSVTDAVLRGIDVTPANSSLASGLQQQFVATGLYSDGSQRDISDQVQWSSENQSVTLVNGDGLFQANSQGSGRIIASYRMQQGYTVLQVTDAVLVSLSLVAESSTQALGTTQQLQLLAQYSDGSSIDVTQQANWSSTDSSVVNVNNSSTDQGRATALAQGSTGINAVFGGLTASQTIEVTSALLLEIKLTDAVVGDLYVNQRRSIHAVGSYSDGSQQNLNQQVLWLSSDEQVIVVSNTSDSLGVMTALSSGSAGISASYAGVTSNVLQYQVVDAPDYPASVSVTATPNVILNNGVDSTSLKATLTPLQSQGSIADGTQVDFTIVEGSTSRTETAYSIDGVASIQLSSQYYGFVQVTVEVVNTDLSATSYVFSSDDFARVLQVLPLTNFVMIDNGSTFRQGSAFALYVRNLSNRDFNIEGYWAQNGGVHLPGSPVTDAAALGGGMLNGGRYTGMIYEFDFDTADNGIQAGYVFSESAAPQPFGFTVNYSQP